MAKKVKHEDHLNHEAWAIPYGDLVTLLLALFVVMYSMSAINEGKFRVAADSLNAAFRGPPRSPTLIPMAPSASGVAPAGTPRPAIMPGQPPHPGSRAAAVAKERPQIAGISAVPGAEIKARAAQARERQQLQKIGDEVHEALGDLIEQDMVVVRRHESWLEVEIRTDILFTSGSARVGGAPAEVLDRVAKVLKDFDNHLRIEGHTDNVPIATREFPSNWELSSARAASVVHRFMGQGVDPRRMTVMGLSEYQPIDDNADEAGRNRNRRVVIVVLANPQHPQLPDLDTQATAEPVAPAEPIPPLAPLPPLAAGTVAALTEHAGP